MRSPNHARATRVPRAAQHSIRRLSRFSGFADGVAEVEDVVGDQACIGGSQNGDLQPLLGDGSEIQGLPGLRVLSDLVRHGEQLEPHLQRHILRLHALG